MSELETKPQNPNQLGLANARLREASKASQASFYASLPSMAGSQPWPFRSAAIAGDERPRKTMHSAAGLTRPPDVALVVEPGIVDSIPAEPLQARSAQSAPVALDVMIKPQVSLERQAHTPAVIGETEVGDSPVLQATQETQEAPVDPVHQRALKSLGLANAGLSLLCVPTGYVDCRFPLTSLEAVEVGERGLFLLNRTGAVEPVDANSQIVSSGPYASIFDAPYQGFWSRVRQLRVELEDGTGDRVWVSYFNPWKARENPRTGLLLVQGVMRQFGKRRFLTELVLPPQAASGRVWVRYVCPGAPSEAAVLSLVNAAKSNPFNFAACAHAVVAACLLSEGQLLEVAEAANGQTYESLSEFFHCLHEPQTPEIGELAALAARAMAVAGICSAAKAANTRLACAQAALNLQHQQIQSLIASQPETLTTDQVNAIDGLVQALKAPLPLNGLLSGDVGTGKTLVYLIPAVAAHRVGAQVAIVSPTEILANQVYQNIRRRFPQARVERVKAGGKIADHSAILVGTSGLGSVAKKADWKPHFLIIDEQHKLSTKDRNSMVAPWTHQLEASATPIPRSLAATLFSGTQVFELHKAPVKRSINSFVLDEPERSQAVAWMRETFEAGHRIAVIYPKVAVSEAQDSKLVKSVLDAAEALQAQFSGKVVMLHGKLSTDELNKNLAAYRSGACPIVVASTIMETGIDIPDIRLMIVKDADNFGTAQLHQLRGRLARNGGAARFVMMVKSVDALQDETHQRLKTVAKVSDGYALAEADMANRGFGDLAGLTQSGNTSSIFKLLGLNLSDFSAH